MKKGIIALIFLVLQSCLVPAIRIWPWIRRVQLAVARLPSWRSREQTRMRWSGVPATRKSPPWMPRAK